MPERALTKRFSFFQYSRPFFVTTTGSALILLFLCASVVPPIDVGSRSSAASASSTGPAISVVVAVGGRNAVFVTVSESTVIDEAVSPFGKSVPWMSSSVALSIASTLTVAPVSISSKPRGVMLNPSSLDPCGTTRPPESLVK